MGEVSIDLSTRWTGLELTNPLVAGAGPLTGNLDGLKRLEDSGIAAAVLPSIFEEQMPSSAKGEPGASSALANAVGNYFHEVPVQKTRTDEQLELAQAARKALSIPIIGSLNGHSAGDWTEYAGHLERAGVDALELNLYFVPADISKSGAEIEAEYIELVRRIREKTRLPLAVKLSPFLSSPGHFVRTLAASGVQGVVLFNRFLQPDIDLKQLSIQPRVVLSGPDEVRLPLRWIGLLSGRVEVALAATTGVHSEEEVLKLLLAGADATMMTSALIAKGPAYARTILSKVSRWLEEHEYQSVAAMKGLLNQANAKEPGAFERAHYMAALTRYGIGDRY